MTQRTSRSAKRLAAAVAVSFSLVAAACGGSDSAEPDSDDTPEETTADAEPEPDDSSDPDAEPEPDDAPADSVEVADDIETDDVVETDSGPVAGGTLRYVLEADVNGINPAASSLSSPGLMMSNAVFDTLMAFTPDGVAVPYLAESLTPSDDFVTWTLKLREGISFHDGTPLDADAIVVNFESQRAHPLVGLAVAPFYPAEGAIKVIDDLTVEWTLLEPSVFLLPGALTSQLGMIASPTWLQAAIDDPTLNQAPIGTGPFKFDSRSEDSTTKFVRNDDWWGGDVYLDAIEFLPVPDPDTRNDLLFSGDVNALHTTTPANVGDLQDDDSVQNIIDENGEESFAMINSAAPPFDDIRAREALAQATPLENYRSLIGLGISRPANSAYVPESKYYNPDVVQQGDNPEAALPLVEAYCAERGDEDNPVTGTKTCTDGKINIELQWSGPSVVQSRIADILDQGWSAAGFNVQFDELLQDDHILQTALGQYNVNTWRQFGAGDPVLDNVWLLCRTIGGISLNWPRFCDEERDALLLEAGATEDEARRIEVYKEVAQKMNEDFLYIFFIHTTWDNAFDETVRGVCDRTSPEGDPLICATNGRTWFSTVWLEN